MTDLIQLEIEEIDGQWWVTCDGNQLEGPFSDRRLAERWVEVNGEPMG